jgi:hypothetical protein
MNDKEISEFFTADISLLSEEQQAVLTTKINALIEKVKVLTDSDIEYLVKMQSIMASVHDYTCSYDMDAKDVNLNEAPSEYISGISAIYHYIKTKEKIKNAVKERKKQEIEVLRKILGWNF